MKIKVTLICLLAAVSFSLKAQTTVTIPDAHFAAWLTAHIPGAMTGSMMDTANSGVTTRTSINVENDSILDLTGIQYFHSLITLDCGNGYSVPNPNNLTSLPRLPASLDTLICGLNSLTSLPALPNALTVLKCYNNPLTTLPALPNSLAYINCNFDQLTSLPALPASLVELYCSGNLLTSLPALPSSFVTLLCDGNHLTSLPALPNSLISLYCDNNQLNSLPALPANLTYLYSSGNMLGSLPALPNSLSQLYCNTNQLTSLPALPASVLIMGCSGNLLTSLPPLPNQLQRFDCSGNSISCFPVFPNALVDTLYFSISGNPFTCLPNYVPAMKAGTLAYPLCTAGDTVNNIHGCAGSAGITGFAFKDSNADCIKNTGDLSLVNIPLKLYSTSNNLLGQTYSAVNGIYDFPDTVGTYIVKIDTAGMNFVIQCAYPGVDSIVTLTGGSPLAGNVNFAVGCKAGFDVGVQSAVQNGWVFPGQQHSLNITAGDISHWYHLNCASGISGQVQVSVIGPVTYNGIVPGALTPAVSGNVYTYTIADFGTVNNSQAFGLLFTTDTSAQAGDFICVSIAVTPTNGDNNPSNNVRQFCYPVVNSHDPNLKEVYPVNVIPGYHDWLTYTIHFQNTGSASAANIRLVDTLNSNLDLETFQVISYSHRNTVSLQGSVLTVRFPNIMLPDSLSNPTGSIGFIQYRIKPKANLPLGTLIKNTANIYFDYNAPVATNTATNEFTSTASINENKLAGTLYVYPNPGKGSYYVKLPEGMKGSEINIKVYNLLGELILNTKTNNSLSQIDLSHQPNGIYVIRVNDGSQTLNQRLIKQ